MVFKSSLNNGNGGGGGGGSTSSITSIAINTLNGFSGTSSGGTTPALTIATTVTGLLKGSATVVSTAIPNVDYQQPIVLTTVGTSGTATFISNVLNIPVYSGGSGASLPTPAQEIPSGAVNGSNTVYTLSQTPYDPKSVQFYIDGSNREYTTDFSVSGTTLTTTFAPASGSLVYTIYNVPSGGNTIAFSAITGGINSSAAMVVGSGSSLTTSGSGTIVATTVGSIGGLVTASTNVTITGLGTAASPYAIASSGGGGGATYSAGTGLTLIPNTFSITSLVTASGIGSSTSIPTVNFNARGQIISTSGNAVIAPANTLTGTTIGSTVITSSLTSVGNLSGGSTAAGFTVNLGTSTITGLLLPINGGIGIDGSAAGNGKIPIGNSSGYSLNNLTAGTSIVVTNTVGNIIISSTGGGSTPKVTVLSQSGAQQTHTGDTVETTAMTYTIPGGTLPANGWLRVTTAWSRSNGGSAAAYTARVRLGGVSGTIYGSQSQGSAATSTLFCFASILANNSTSAQKAIFQQQNGMGAPYTNGSNGTANTSALDMTSNQDLVISYQLVNSGDTAKLDFYCVELLQP